MRRATLGTWLMAVSLVMLLVGTDAATATQAKIVRQGQAESGAVALTFDDGADRGACARIARTLRAFDATGTFFVNGNNLKAAPSRWRQILRGQVVGNHTRSHRDLTAETDVKVRKQLLQNEWLHERILGRPMLKVFRPPYGAHDRRVRRLAGELDYRYTVLWTVDTFDWMPTATVDSVVRRATRARPGSIILMHCSRSVTPAALPAIIRHYRGRGIELAGLDEVLGMKDLRVAR